MKKYQEFVDSISQKDYDQSAQRFKDLGMLANVSLSLAGEAGELIDAVKKHILYGKSLDLENVKEELGDILFYVAMAANHLGLTLEDIAEINQKKLEKRYPDGCFSEQHAIHRLDKQKGK